MRRNPLIGRAADVAAKELNEAIGILTEVESAFGRLKGEDYCGVERVGKALKYLHEVREWLYALSNHGDR